MGYLWVRFLAACCKSARGMPTYGSGCMYVWACAVYCVYTHSCVLFGFLLSRISYLRIYMCKCIQSVGVINRQSAVCGTVWVYMYIHTYEGRYGIYCQSFVGAQILSILWCMHEFQVYLLVEWKSSNLFGLNCQVLPLSYVHTHTHTHTHVRARALVRTYIHTVIHIYTCTHVCAHTHTYTHVHTQTYTHVHTYTYTHLHTHTHTHTYTHVHTRTHTHTHTHTYTHTRTHAHTHTYTHVHTRTHTDRQSIFSAFLPSTPVSSLSNHSCLKCFEYWFQLLQIELTIKIIFNCTIACENLFLTVYVRLFIRGCCYYGRL